MEAICIIPARGGSKGIPKKNLQKIHGRSLLEITIRSAQMADCFREIVVSTDDQEIETQARRLGAWVMDQPDASDTSLPDQAEAFVLSRLTDFDVVCRLFVTTPFRSVKDICEPVRMVKDGEASAVVSVTAPTHYPSQHVRSSGDGFYAGHLQRVWKQPRQYWSDLRVLNGAVYVSRLDHFRERAYFSPETKLYEMPACRSFDIDTLADLEEARRR